MFVVGGAEELGERRNRPIAPQLDADGVNALIGIELIASTLLESAVFALPPTASSNAWGEFRMGPAAD